RAVVRSRSRAGFGFMPFLIILVIATSSALVGRFASDFPKHAPDSARLPALSGAATLLLAFAFVGAGTDQSLVVVEDDFGRHSGGEPHARGSTHSRVEP